MADSNMKEDSTLDAGLNQYNESFLSITEEDNNRVEFQGFTEADVSLNNSKDNHNEGKSLPNISSEQTGKQFPYNEYNHTDQGPFRVVIERVHDTLHINKIAIGKWLSRIILSNSIIEIKKIGRNKVVVYFDNLEDANELIKRKKHDSYLIYLPLHFISVKGVVTGIPQDVELEEIKYEIECEAPILDMYRMKRFVDNESVLSDRICITFRSNILPTYAKIWYCRSRVDPFIPKIIMCEKCLRFNHWMKNCKGKKRCGNCCNLKCDNMDDECKAETCCLYCKKNHKTTDRNACKEWQIQKKIKTIMAKRAMIYQEVKDEFDFLSRNRFELLNNKSMLNVYEAFEERKKKIGQKQKIVRELPKGKQILQIPNKTSSVQDMEVAETSELNRKRRREEQEELGVALNNPHKSSEAEKAIHELKSNIQNLEKHYQSILFNVYQKVGTIKEAAGLTFELEKNLKFQFINNGPNQVADG